MYMCAIKWITLLIRANSHFQYATAGNPIFKITCHASKFYSKFANDPTAGLIVIGDEILKGQVVDENTNFIAKGLYGQGVKLAKVSVVGDNIEDISDEVKNFSKSYTFVITTGGIGPTHDDLTYEAVAHAFGESLFPHPELVKICQDFFKTSNLDAPALKLALIPKSSVLNYGYDKKKGVRTLYPIISVHNVHIFPGVSRLMKNSFTLLSDDLFGKDRRKFYLKEMFLTARETEIANDLNKVVGEYQTVNFGSYPNFFNSYYGVKLTVESVDENLVEEAYQKLKSLIPAGLIVNYDAEPLVGAYGKIQKLLNCDATQAEGTKLKESIKDSLNILEECEKKFRPNEVALCFSGGKGSSVLLHLWYAVLSQNNLTPETSIQAVRFKDGHGKDELNAFIQESSERYKLDLVTVEGTMKDNLKQYLLPRPHIKMLVIGARNCDIVKGRLNGLMEVDIGEKTPKKIYPIFKWSYGDIWNFLRLLSLPYCDLYDAGYTSLGSNDDTSPNPKLASAELVYSLGARRGSNYYPAYKLTDWDAERLK